MDISTYPYQTTGMQYQFGHQTTSGSTQFFPDNRSHVPLIPTPESLLSAPVLLGAHDQYSTSNAQSRKSFSNFRKRLYLKKQNLETNTSQIRGNATPGQHQHLSYSIPRRNRFIDESLIGRSNEGLPAGNEGSYSRPSKLNRTTIQNSRVQNSVKQSSSLLNQLNLSSLDVSSTS